MKAEPQAQLRLLDLQELDTGLDQLAHRRAHLPELAEITELTQRVSALNEEVGAADTAAGDIAAEQSRVEADVDKLRARAERDQQRLDSGRIGSPRELEDLRHEVRSLRRRQAELEDAVLEIMERREQAEARARARRGERDELSGRLAGLEQRRDEAFAEIDEQAAAKQSQREAIAREIPQDLLSLYEKLRSQTGVGAAALHRGRCEGCHLTLNAVDLNRIRRAEADEVQRCDECRRILVRWPEAG